MIHFVLSPLPDDCPYCLKPLQSSACPRCGRIYKATDHIVHETDNFYILELGGDYRLSVKDINCLYSIDPLKASIEKWTCITDFRKSNPGVHVEDGGASTCGLCLDNPVTCTTCPIYEVTKQSFCSGTPYENGTPEEELEFLKGLI